MTSVVFMGTPDAAVPTLEILAEEHDLRAVVTRPDRPRGRSGAPAPPPVKQAAERLGIDVFQPVGRLELDDALLGLRPYEVGVVVAFGRILSATALSAPARGTLNVHFSLLPRWRGAAPVARALMAGDEMTGVTIIELDEGLDTGDVLTAQAIDIKPDEEAGDLTRRLALAGARLLNAVLDEYAKEAMSPVPQVDEGMSYAPLLEASDRILDPAMTTGEFLNRVRALAPAPGAHLDIDGVRTRILRASRSDGAAAPGRWELVDSRPVIGVADGAVELLRLQPAGKRVMTGEDWGRGKRSSGGAVVG
jgi:methionyl-tRNA formyltransferase